MAKKAAEMLDMTHEELTKEEQAKREEIFKLRLQRSTGQLPDPHKIQRVRRELARIMTVKRSKELASAGGKR